MKNQFKKLISFFLAAALLLIPFAAQAEAQGAPAGASDSSFAAWNISGLSADLKMPSGVAADSRGNVYIADRDNNSIIKVSPSGTVIKQWGQSGYGNGEFRQPYGIAVDSKDNVYVVDRVNCRVQKFTSNGDFLLSFGAGQLDMPEFIATDSSNKVYVADTQNDRIVIFDSNGRMVSQFGTYGTGHGQFQYLGGIAVDSAGNIYVAESYIGSEKIQKFNARLEYVTQFGASGRGDGQFYCTRGLAIDSSNHLYVVDEGSRVQEFTSGGALIAKWGTKGSGAQNQFDQPRAIALDIAGNIYIADTWNNRIMRKAGSGTLPIDTPVRMTCRKTNVSSYGKANGCITIVASGGSGAYKYSIDSGATWQISGSFRSLKAGTYTAMACDAANPSNKASASVTITQPNPPNTKSYAADKLPSKANVGKPWMIKPPSAPKGYTLKSIAYSSDKKSVATVDQNGYTKFLKPGKVALTIKAVFKDQTGKTKTTTIKKAVTVSQLVSSIKLSKTSATVARKAKVTLKATIAPSSATNKKVRWTSSNTRVATVSSSGVVTGKAKGTVVITCTAQDGSKIKATCKITVK